MQTTKTIAELETAAETARKTHAAAFARCNTVRMMIAAMREAEGAVDECPLDVRAMVESSVDFAVIPRLIREQMAMGAEVARLEDVYHDACAALNDAPEEAA